MDPRTQATRPEASLLSRSELHVLQDTLPCPNTASSAATTHIVEIMIEPAAAKAHTIFIDYSIGADAPIGELWPSLSASEVDLGDAARLANLSPLGNSICAKLTTVAGRTLGSAPSKATRNSC